MNTQILFIILFISFCLQMLATYFQAKNYRITLKEMSSNGILGIGHTKGTLKKGNIVIISYSEEKDQILKCCVMKGITVFARFHEFPDLKNLTLENTKNYIKSHSKNLKKDAFYQAIKAIEEKLD